MSAREQNDDQTWAIVLAAGRGQRMERLTRALYGRDLPKQFAALAGEQTFLQQTMARASRLAPAARTIVVVAEEHGPLAREQLAGFAGAHVVEQPRDVGTLPGLLLPLAHVLDAAPDARVVVCPSDHHFERLGPFVDAVAAALQAVAVTPMRTVLVGARADRAATDLGWVLPGHELAWGGEAGVPARSVESFVEKPTAPVAARLHAAGALWNTLVLAIDGSSFWEGALAAQPLLAHSFQRYRSSVGTPSEDSVRREIYARLPSLDLSRDLLAARPGLGVVEMNDAGWSDCGTPERLFECLAGSGGLDWLLGRLGVAGRAGIETQV